MLIALMGVLPEEPARSTRRGGRQPRYTVDQVLDEALELIDAEGLQGFSMRRLAERMDIGPMTLYGYVRTSEEILDRVTGLALHGLVEDLDPSLPWERQLEVAVTDLHDALRSHPGVLELLLAKPSPSPQLDLVRETLLAILREAGFDADVAWEGVGILGAYALGFASSQVSLRQPGSAVERLKSLPADQYPHLAELAERYPTHLGDAAFARGLRHLVEGLSRDLTAAAKPTPTRRRARA
jgi:AcrR family transcriptional regulator